MLILEAGERERLLFENFLSGLCLSDKMVRIINSFVTEQSFCIARMVFEKGGLQWLF